MVTEQEKKIIQMLMDIENDTDMAIGVMCLIRQRKIHDEAEKWLMENKGISYEVLHSKILEWGTEL